MPIITAKANIIRLITLRLPPLPPTPSQYLLPLTLSPYRYYTLHSLALTSKYPFCSVTPLYDESASCTNVEHAASATTVEDCMPTAIDFHNALRDCDVLEARLRGGEALGKDVVCTSTLL
jgi:hypothetical protein